MESMRQLLSGTIDKVAPDLAITGDKAADMFSKKFGESVFSPALNDADAGCYTESEWAGSEDSACSIESDASSNAISINSLVSDADSLAPSCDEKIVEKCPSGGSIVTYDEAVSKINGEGECKAADDRQRRAKRGQADAQFDEEDTSINTAPRVEGSAGKAWTDDKHCSYLNSIEATFVRSLLKQDYGTVDMSEQDQDCVESRPMDPSYLAYHHGPGELFTSLQRGCYDQREYYRPHYIFAPSSHPAVLASPWIQHFNPRIAPPTAVGGAAQDMFPGHTTSSSGFAEGVHCSNMYQGVMEEVMESVPVLPDFPLPQDRNNRFQSQHNASTSAPVRPDTSAQAKKRNLDPCAEVMYRPKKLKSTQRKLAETDLELEEQFVLKQLNQKEEGSRIDIRESGSRLDCNSNPHRSNHLEEHDQNDAQNLQGSLPTSQPTGNGEIPQVAKPSAQEERSNSREQEDDRKRTGDGESGDGKSPASSEGVSSQKDVVDGSGQLTGSVEDKGITGESVQEPVVTGARLKLSLDESIIKCQADLGYDEHDECNFVAKRSPRACRTYTWGIMGNRRPLLPGNAKDIREDETLAKEQQQC
ncbi:hypothetical protein Mapa_015811 [Marchantia paleacea]|nr:hypothetical protein Mapa_015811 [Marchantia paleacea]